MVEEVWDWEESTEVVVVAMGSQQAVEVMEVEWCMEEVWAEVPGPW